MIFLFWANWIAKWVVGLGLVLVRIWLWTAWAFGATAAMRMMDRDYVRSNVMPDDLYVLLAAITTYLVSFLAIVLWCDGAGESSAAK
jgi:hypothetical protein